MFLDKPDFLPCDVSCKSAQTVDFSPSHRSPVSWRPAHFSCSTKQSLNRSGSGALHRSRIWIRFGRIQLEPAKTRVLLIKVRIWIRFLPVPQPDSAKPDQDPAPVKVQGSRSGSVQALPQSIAGCDRNQKRIFVREDFQGFRKFCTKRARLDAFVVFWFEWFGGWVQCRGCSAVYYILNYLTIGY